MTSYRMIKKNTRAVIIVVCVASVISSCGTNKSIKVNNIAAESAIEHSFKTDSDLIKADRLYWLGSERESAASYYRRAADRGNPFAAARLAVLYYSGWSIEEDKKQAEYWARKSIPALEKMASERSPRALYSLGHLHQKGIGVDINLELAHKYYKRSAALDFLPAYNRIGHMYRAGEHVEKDLSQAVSWYEKAATHDFAPAQYSLGFHYFEEAKTTNSDAESYYKKALYWYRRAADLGHAKAQFNLGWHYQHGVGVSQNNELAFYWIEKSADQNMLRSIDELGVMHSKINKDYAQSMVLYLRAAERNYKFSQNNIGLMYLNGTGVKQDFSQALSWFHKAADQGLAFSQYNIGWMYEYGLGVKTDETQAVSWYRKSAEQGHLEAEGRLGYMYSSGKGVKKDLKKALLWAHKSASQGYPNAQLLLGAIYVSEDNKEAGIEPAEAINWLQKAAEQGVTPAHVYLGMIYFQGLGVDIDYEKAANWLQKPADEGMTEAQVSLAALYLEGKGVEQNRSAAINLLEEAAAQGSKEAAELLSSIKDLARYQTSERAKFAWPANGKVRVTESHIKSSSVREGVSAANYGKSAYDLVITQNEQTGERSIDYNNDNFELIEEHRLSTDPVVRENQLKLVSELNSELSTNPGGFTVSRTGELLAIRNTDVIELTKIMLNSDLIKVLVDEESQVKLLDLSQSQKLQQLSPLAKIMVEEEVRALWSDWVYFWTDFPLDFDSNYETTGEEILHGQDMPYLVKIEKLPLDDPNHKNMVKWRAHKSWRPTSEAMDKIAFSIESQASDAMNTPSEERSSYGKPMFESFEKTKEVIIITDPETLQPAYVTIEIVARSHVRGEYPIRTYEARQYEFDWTIKSDNDQ